MQPRDYTMGRVLRKSRESAKYKIGPYLRGIVERPKLYETNSRATKKSEKTTSSGPKTGIYGHYHVRVADI
jgi:hypothetical protein